MSLFYFADRAYLTKNVITNRQKWRSVSAFFDFGCKDRLFPQKPQKI